MGSHHEQVKLRGVVCQFERRRSTDFGEFAFRDTCTELWVRQVVVLVSLVASKLLRKLK